MKQIIVLLIVAMLLSGCSKERQHMAIDNGSSGTTKYVSFSSVSQLDNLNQKTIRMWIYINANPTNGTSQSVMDKGFTNFAGWALDFVNTGGAYVNRLNYVHGFSSAVGVWYIPSNAISTGAMHHLVITYDKTSTANDPVFWLDGVSQTVTEFSAPVGTVDNDAGQALYLGNRSSGNMATWWKYYPVLIYNRIWSAAEVADDYASREAIHIKNGLVFAPSLVGGAGLQVFDGSTLAAGNTIPDQVSGVLGVPNGSPLAVADTYLTYR